MYSLVFSASADQPGLKKYTTPCISKFLLSHPMIYYELIKIENHNK